MSIKDYKKGSVRYQYCANRGFFKHNLSNDYQLFIIWEYGRPYAEQILRDIAQRFTVLSVASVQWSDTYVLQNFNRLYKAIDDPHISGKADTMGRGEFLCIVVEDLAPEYHYRQTVSGNIELVNSAVVDLKRAARQLCDGNYVHSSASPDEFFEQGVLLFGEALLQSIVAGQQPELALAQDLQGTAGWSSFSDLFNTLQYTSNYLVLRNFEYLPFDFFANDNDIDALCDNAIDFITAANAKVLSLTDGGAKLLVEVETKKVPVDLRFIGGRYYDPRWEQDMLQQRVKGKGNVYQPRLDHYFFSLLYHATLQKPYIKPIYIERFTSMAEKLQFDFFDISKVDNNKYIAELFKGFLTAQNYVYTKPEDPEVYINHQLIKLIPKELGGGDQQRLYRFIKLILPQEFINLIPVSIRLKVSKILFNK